MQVNTHYLWIIYIHVTLPLGLIAQVVSGSPRNRQRGSSIPRNKQLPSKYIYIFM